METIHFGDLKINRQEVDCVISWQNNNKQVGKLTWNDGVLKFEGDAEESARLFLEFVAKLSGRKLDISPAPEAPATTS